jgi:hypothetical protein
MFRDVGARDRVAECIQELAFLACSNDLDEQAARLSGAAEATQEGSGTALWPSVRARRDRDLAAVRDKIGTTAFRQAWSDGRAMSLEQAVTHALSEASQV